MTKNLDNELTMLADEWMVGYLTGEIAPSETSSDKTQALEVVARRAAPGALAGMVKEGRDPATLPDEEGMARVIETIYRRDVVKELTTLAATIEAKARAIAEGDEDALLDIRAIANATKTGGRVYVRLDSSTPKFSTANASVTIKVDRGTPMGHAIVNACHAAPKRGGADVTGDS